MTSFCLITAAPKSQRVWRTLSGRSSPSLDRIPAGRWGTPEDMQGAAVFLASKASDYVNGYTVAVDGGWLAR